MFPPPIPSNRGLTAHRRGSCKVKRPQARRGCGGHCLPSCRYAGKQTSSLYYCIVVLLCSPRPKEHCWFWAAFFFLDVLFQFVEVLVTCILCQNVIISGDTVLARLALRQRADWSSLCSPDQSSSPSSPSGVHTTLKVTTHFHVCSIVGQLHIWLENKGRGSLPHVRAS